MAEGREIFHQSNKGHHAPFCEVTHQAVIEKTPSPYIPNTIQFTLADGFFNRRRGRPPKNRYVQVYKNLQLPPQAVFTSFKLERKGSSSAPSFPSLKLDENDRKEEVLAFSSESLLNMDRPTYIENYGHLNEAVVQKSPKIGAENLEQQPKSVIRSTGIYYPGRIANDEASENSMNVIEDTSLQLSESGEKTNRDLPEDLSIRKCKGEEQNSNIKLTHSYLQMVQLINLYYQTLQWQPSVVSGVSSSKDADTMLDFSRHHYSEDCGFRYCKYRQRQTHYHCVRFDCQYGFCERSRFAQHATRHIRLDRLLGTDFKRYQPHVDCGYANCIANKTCSKKASLHFHCLRCKFTCYETYKFGPHRRWHSKLEELLKAGFRRFHYSEPCKYQSPPDSGHQPCACVYSGVKTHYHCLHCDYSVLSRSQTLGHKHKSPLMQP